MTNDSKKFTEEEIDEFVVKEADDLSKWEKPIKVKAPQAIPIKLSSELVKKAKFLSALHKRSNYHDWLESIIKERIELEEELVEAIKSNLPQQTP